MPITNARWLKRGQVSLDEVRSLVEAFHDQSKIKPLLGALGEIAEYDSDVAVVDGDLAVDGDLDTHKDGIYLLVVKGDLRVTGCIHDYDDPESFLVVHGSARAGAVITAGWLEVHGDLEVERVLLGDYNDCAAWIDGSVRTPVFYGEEHHFTIKGALEADVILGRPRLAIANPPTAAIPLTDARVLQYIDRDLLRIEEDGDSILVDGFKNYRDVRLRVASGLPLRG